jgi:uncharacterized protein YxeA
MINVLFFLLVFIVLLMLLIVLLLMVAPLKAVFMFNSEQMDEANVTVTWLSSIVKAIVSFNDGKRHMTIYLLKSKVYEKELKSKGFDYDKNIRLIKAIKPDYIRLHASYGFKDPSITGMACAVIGFAANYIKLDDLYNAPDFTADSDYFNISGAVVVNAATAITAVTKERKQNFHTHALHGSR